MQDSVKIMDIDIDMLTNDVFIQLMNQYLNDDHLDVILFASTELLNYAVKDDFYRELIERAELCLPGEEALLTSHHVDVLEAGDMVVSCRSFGMMLENLTQEQQTMYIIVQDENILQQLCHYCQTLQPGLSIVGSCIYDSTMEDATLVNEINSHTPDFLLVDLPTGLQERWIMDHVSLLNAKLCIAIGGVAGIILASQKKIPSWVKKFHVEGLYQLLVREQHVKKEHRAKRFRKKMVQYDQIKNTDNE